METSVVIRTKNEQKWLGVVLKKLKMQTYTDFEIVIVDSGSVDKTLEIANEYDTKIFHIKPEEFSYPFALNVGCREARGEKYFVFLSAHSVPISETWLQDGINNFCTKNVAGVYGNVMALPDGSIWEKLIFNKWLGRIDILFKRKKIIAKYNMGVMGFTNAIVRKDLWQKYHFNEAFGMGGEDGDWVRYWSKREYVFVCDPRFSVYHSHGLNLRGVIAQYKHWKTLGKPQSFYKQKYRK